MPSFISLTDHSQAQLHAILDRADVLYDAWQKREMPRTCEGKRTALWFYGSGFRNRAAFELGARAMGADVSFVPGELGVHEPLQDIGMYLANWFDLLVVRAARHDDLVYLSEISGIPLINARTDRSHPCEIMGDLQYIRRTRGSLNDLRVVFVGEVTNLCMSWFEAAARLPITVIQVAPEKYLAGSGIISALGASAKGSISVTEALESAVEGADVIYTDCWPKCGDDGAIRDVFLPYQITNRHLNRMNPNGYFLPCPPVTRGQEVDSESMDHALCRNIAAKKFLLHAQNAIIEYALGTSDG